MAHFAQLDDDNKVIAVHVVANAALDPENEEASGIAFLTEWSGGHTKWVQTSYNHSIRKTFAAAGYTYDPQRDIFIFPQPYPSWVLDENGDWQPPIPYPDDGLIYVWNEDDQDWEAYVEQSEA